MVGGSGFEPLTGSKAELRAATEEYEGAKYTDWDRVWEHMLGDLVLTREQMESDPKLSAALAAWERGDRSVEADEVARSYIADLFTLADNSHERRLIEEYAHIPSCAAALHLASMLPQIRAWQKEFPIL